MRECFRKINRTYLDGAVYFVTTVTDKRKPYFSSKTLRNLLIKIIEVNAATTKFILLAYAILPDQMHVLLKVDSNKNISEIMRSIKTNFSREANRVIGNKIDPIDEVSRPRLYVVNAKHLRKEYSKEKKKLSRFRWQKSFQDRVIVSEKDLSNCLEYIRFNHLKYGLSKKDVSIYVNINAINNSL